VSVDWGAVGTVAGPLVGVVIGGYITTRSTFVLDKRREARETAAAKELDRRRLLVAARVVETELSTAFGQMFLLCLRSDWRSISGRLETTSWKRYRTELADSDMPYVTWRELVRAYRVIEQLNADYDRARDLSVQALFEPTVKYYFDNTTLLNGARIQLITFIRTLGDLDVQVPSASSAVPPDPIPPWWEPPPDTASAADG